MGWITTIQKKGVDRTDILNFTTNSGIYFVQDVVIFSQCHHVILSWISFNKSENSKTDGPHFTIYGTIEKYRWLLRTSPHIVDLDCGRNKTFFKLFQYKCDTDGGYKVK